MRKHKMVGLPVKIEKGPLKGKYIKVINYLVTQYQGKSIEKLAQTKHALLDPLRQRKLPIDDDVVFGQLIPSKEFICVHDTELQVDKPDLKIVKENEDGTSKPSEGDNNPSSPGESEPSRRSVSGGKSTDKPKGPTKVKG